MQDGHVETDNKPRSRTKNKITDVRNLIIETMERLLDEDDRFMTFERAQMVSDLSQVYINSVKVEVDFCKNMGVLGSGVIPFNRAEIQKLKDTNF